MPINIYDKVTLSDGKKMPKLGLSFFIWQGYLCLPLASSATEEQLQEFMSASLVRTEKAWQNH